MTENQDLVDKIYAKLRCRTDLFYLYREILDMDKGIKKATAMNRFWINVRDTFWSDFCELWGIDEGAEVEYVDMVWEMWECDIIPEVKDVFDKDQEDFEDYLKRIFPECFLESEVEIAVGKTKEEIKRLFDFTKDVFYNNTDYKRALDLLLQLIDKEKVESNTLIPKTKNREKLKITLYYISQRKNLLFCGKHRRNSLSEFIQEHFEDYKDKAVSDIYKHLGDDPQMWMDNLEVWDKNHKIP